MIGTIMNPRVAAEIGEAFGAASAQSRARLERSRRREEQGQAATREDTFTDDLLDAMELAIQESLHHLSATLAQQGTNVRIEFEATKALKVKKPSSDLIWA
ncbi:MAG TPA: hypothetical protein VJN18_12505 [Polyangiaceae bacterium]|nr:hypothetical protein [Polyangiaceae bacterium]